MKNALLALLLIISSACAASTVSETGSSHLYPAGAHSQGLAKRRDSFLHPSPLLDFETKLDFKIGQAIFEKIWVFAPSSTTASDGLGPLYNARSCARCHTRNGRGQLNTENTYNEAFRATPSLFLRLSVAPKTSIQESKLVSGQLGFIPEPTYGSQLQTFAYPGGKAEAQLSISYTEEIVSLSDEETVSLRAPHYQIIEPQYGPLARDLMISPRISSSMIGLGLLEAISEEDILSQADPEDLDQNGISGKANYVWDIKSQSTKLGRFGWKAGNPSLAQQNAAAFSGDIGISTEDFPQHWGDCTLAQANCRNQAHGNRTRQSPSKNHLEAPKKLMDALLLYTRNIAVPLRQKENQSIRKGRQLFHKIGCASCHTPSFTTSAHQEQASLNGQTIWPYTDLLLHDMGPGLADNRPEFQANGQEWRTPPLWGLGSHQYVNDGNFLLHDGRARTILEAIMWHGGEAEASKRQLQALSTDQRTQLLTFLESL